MSNTPMIPQVETALYPGPCYGDDHDGGKVTVWRNENGVPDLCFDCRERQKEYEAENRGAKRSMVERLVESIT